MTRPRPRIPVAARLAAARRQAHAMGLPVTMPLEPISNGKTLAILLRHLFGDEKTHCDHNPALILRAFNERRWKRAIAAGKRLTNDQIAALYTPNANNPDDLLHRTTHGHHLKTNVAGDGAQRSDTAARMHQRRMDENRGIRKRRPKAKIAQRPNAWPKGRKIERRGFQR